MKVVKPLNHFRLIGQLTDAGGRRFRREMSIATSETFDQLSDRADKLLTHGRDNVELDSFMLIPAPSNDKPEVSTETEAEPGRWARAMSAAANAIGMTPEGTGVVQQSVVHVIPPLPPLSPLPVYSRPYVAPPLDDLKAEDGITRVAEEMVVQKLDASEEETVVCFVSKT